MSNKYVLVNEPNVVVLHNSEMAGEDDMLVVGTDLTTMLTIPGLSKYFNTVYFHYYIDIDESVLVFYNRGTDDDVVMEGILHHCKGILQVAKECEEAV